MNRKPTYNGTVYADVVAVSRVLERFAQSPARSRDYDARCRFVKQVLVKAGYGSIIDDNLLAEQYKDLLLKIRALIRHWILTDLTTQELTPELLTVITDSITDVLQDGECE